MNEEAERRAAQAKKWKPYIAASRMLQHAATLIKAGEAGDWSKAHSLATRAFDYNCIAGERAYSDVITNIAKLEPDVMREDLRTLWVEMEAAAEQAKAAGAGAKAKAGGK